MVITIQLCSPQMRSVLPFSLYCYVALMALSAVQALASMSTGSLSSTVRPLDDCLSVHM